MNPFKDTRNTLAIILGIGLSISLVQHSQASDLWDIYQSALVNDPEYQAAEFNDESTQIDLPLARTAFRPIVSASGQLGRQISDVTGTTQSSDDNALGLSVTLPLYNKADRVAITQSELQVKVSSLQLQEARQALMLRVANRYFNLLAARDATEVARLEKVAIRRQMDLANERLEVGLGTRTDLFDAKARFKLSEANEIQAQNQINNEVALLKQIIGMTPEALAPLDNSAPLSLPFPNNVDVWTKKSLELNVSLQIQTLNLEIAAQEIEKQKTGRSPTISLSGSQSITDSGSSFSSSTNSFTTSGEINSASIELVVRFPIYQGGATNLKTQRAGAQYNRVDRLLEQAKRLASTQTTSSFLSVASGVSQVEALFEAITAGESALEAKEEGFRAGLTTNLDVLDAQRDLSRSRTDYLRARYNYIISVLELERSAGQLDENDIKRVNKWLGLISE